jgi:hypothetical protein
VLLLDGPGRDSGTVELAAERTARAILALVASRDLLRRPAIAQPGGGS